MGMPQKQIRTQTAGDQKQMPKQKKKKRASLKPLLKIPQVSKCKLKHTNNS